MSILNSVSLLPFNTFGIDVKAERFASIATVEQLQALLEVEKGPFFVLGGGSNVLFTRDPEALILHNRIEGIRISQSRQNKVWVTAGAGVSWHSFVCWAVAEGLGGIENLSLIPGTVGAAPVQNIGAYGVELKDIFISLEAIDLQSGRRKRFNRAQCRFGYRDSFFKQEGKGRYFISSVTLSLTRQKHRIHTQYGDIQKTLADWGISRPDIADISRAVIHIRSAKLPDPALIGNCGSFFKNPETDASVLENIRASYPNAPGFALPDGRVKIPAGWLIEQCGWKGKRVGNTGCYEKQALVLVNYGHAQGAEVQALAKAIVESVQQRFGIRLEAEVNIL